jgi:hypothetical protein
MSCFRKNNPEREPTIQERFADIPPVIRELLTATARDIEAYEKNNAKLIQLDEAICALLREKEKATATVALLRPKVEDVQHKVIELTSNTLTTEQISEFKKTVVDKHIIDDKRYRHAVKLECDFEDLKSSDYWDKIKTMLARLSESEEPVEYTPEYCEKFSWLYDQIRVICDVVLNYSPYLHPVYYDEITQGELKGLKLYPQMSDPCGKEDKISEWLDIYNSWLEILEEQINDDIISLKIPL